MYRSQKKIKTLKSEAHTSKKNKNKKPSSLCKFEVWIPSPETNTSWNYFGKLRKLKI